MSKKKKKDYKHQNITKNSFDFIKYVCVYCGKGMYSNKLFCSEECRILYFEKKNKITIEEYMPQKKQDKRRVYGLLDILDDEKIADMVKETTKNIDKKLKRKRNIK